MKYFLFILCLILFSCVPREDEEEIELLPSSSSFAYPKSSSSKASAVLYFDEEKFQSEWDFWESQDIKNYNFTLKGKLPYWFYPKAKNYSGAILMYDYEVKIAVKNGIMDSFKYIGGTPSENGSIIEPEYVSISDMYQKIYNQIKNTERELSNLTNDCFISIRYEIKYDQGIHYITRSLPTYEINSGCVADISAHEVVVSDFLKN